MVRRGSGMYVAGVGWKSQIFAPATFNKRHATRDDVALKVSGCVKLAFFYLSEYCNLHYSPGL